MTKNNIAIFASGSGTNAQSIIEYFNKNNSAKVVLVVSNNPNAFVLERAKKLNVDQHVFNIDSFKNNLEILTVLTAFEVKWIVLAGFLLKVPEYIIDSFKNKIINIHPALLPKYGGKGMYGKHVHQAVVDNKEKKSGISIHYVTKNYDEGSIIFQATCDINEFDSPVDVAKKVQQLEQQHFAREVDKLIRLDRK
jgi:phosphoribosylglycinamide formyltransferase-1